MAIGYRDPIRQLVQMDTNYSSLRVSDSERTSGIESLHPKARDPPNLLRTEGIRLPKVGVLRMCNLPLRGVGRRTNQDLERTVPGAGC